MDSSISPQLPNATGYKKFQVDRTLISRPNHYDINEIGGTGAFFAEVHALNRRKPDLTLRTGSTIEGRITAVSHIVVFGGHFKIGFGDPAKVDSVQWEEMTRQKRAISKYLWDTAFAGEAQEKYGGRRTLFWKRTKTACVEGMEMPTVCRRNYKLVDEKTGEILAVFTSKRSRNKCGVLEIRAKLGESFEQLAIITCLTLYERARRE